MIYITYISIVYLLYERLNEMYNTYIDYKQWLYIHNNSLHTIQHQILLFMAIIIMILMFLNCQNIYGIPILLYNLYAIFFLIPHFKNERENKY
jgi:hypothetical protein